MTDRADPRYFWQLLRAGEFRLDGGSMFGLIPRTVWSRAVGAAVDERGRIPVNHNCLLLTREGAKDGEREQGPRRVLIEVGTGDKLDAKSKELFSLGDRTIVDALGEAGVGPGAIDAVILSHLHFDHAGALTRLCRPGETPDWTGPASGMAVARPDHGVARTFPNAAVYTQAREWADALANRSVMTRTYFKDHLEPIAGQVRTLDSPPPFPPGYVPGRDEAPAVPLEGRMTEIVHKGAATGIRVFLTPGHTWGQQAVAFTDVEGRTVVFTPDVMPTAWHVGAAYSLAYDVEPYASMVSRRWFLEAAAKGDWILCLDHEPSNPLRRVRRTEKGAFELAPHDEETA